MKFFQKIKQEDPFIVSFSFLLLLVVATGIYDLIFQVFLHNDFIRIQDVHHVGVIINSHYIETYLSWLIGPIVVALYLFWSRSFLNYKQSRFIKNCFLLLLFAALADMAVVYLRELLVLPFYFEMIAVEFIGSFISALLKTLVIMVVFTVTYALAALVTYFIKVWRRVTA